MEPKANDIQGAEYSRSPRPITSDVLSNVRLTLQAACLSLLRCVFREHLFSLYVRLSFFTWPFHFSTFGSMVHSSLGIVEHMEETLWAKL